MRIACSSSSSQGPVAVGAPPFGDYRSDFYKNKWSGFTLIELMIALFIFSIIAVLCGSALHLALRTQESQKKHQKELAELQYFLQIFHNDVSQMIDRPVVLKTGLTSASVLLKSQPNIYLEFTRGGDINFMRSDLQRVAYELRGDKLYRLWWSVLDQKQDTPVLSRVLLHDVKRLSIAVADVNHRWLNTWPLYNSLSQTMPSMVKMSLCWQDQACLDDYQRVYATPWELTHEIT